MTKAGHLQVVGACPLTVFSVACLPVWAAPGLFGEDEVIQTVGMERFDKWNDMLVRFTQHQTKGKKRPCQTELLSVAGSPRPVDFCKLAPWRDFVQVTKLQTFSPD